MTDRGHIYQAGEDPLAPRYMTPEQVAELLRLVQQRGDREARRAAAARWNPGARQLTSAQVVAMREERVAGAKLAALAERYGVSCATVLRIVTGQRYRDVGGPRSWRVR